MILEKKYRATQASYWMIDFDLRALSGDLEAIVDDGVN